MSDLFSKISKAVDAFSDVLTEDVDSKKSLEVYRYDDFKNFCLRRQKADPRVRKCTISITLENEVDGIVFSERKYLIRMVLLDDINRPIPIGNNADELMGNIIIASSIDARMRDFMGDKKEKTVIVQGGK